MTCHFAAIADDFTGGSDLAGMLAERGVPTVQIFGLRSPEFFDSLRRRYGAAVLSLKSRSIPSQAASQLSVAALGLLRRLEPGQVQFKYCSTFDSTPRGNIGPVTDALMTAMGQARTIAVPALPVNGRTQYQGYLFVGRALLSESALRYHPLNPMTDANLVRWLQQQTERKVGLADLAAVRGGRLKEALEGCEIALVDALDEDDLGRIAEAAVDLPLITGGSGLARHLPRLWGYNGSLPKPERRTGARRTLILSGSCSAATLEQLDRWKEGGGAVLRQERTSEDAVERELGARGVALVASSAPPGERQGDARVIERSFGALAARAVREWGVTDVIVAGGETSGAVVEALDVAAVELTGIVAPGVPSLRAIGEARLSLVLKSGNFGAPDFFRDAMQHLEER
ncbi:MAG: four-carbon acid sugar kinase family protein [Bryobacter sp.]|nr:four-carbon acid sugar kinase family protein [Bryobacter sp.]